MCFHILSHILPLSFFSPVSFFLQALLWPHLYLSLLPLTSSCFLLLNRAGTRTLTLALTLALTPTPLQSNSLCLALLCSTLAYVCVSVNISTGLMSGSLHVHMKRCRQGQTRSWPDMARQMYWQTQATQLKPFPHTMIPPCVLVSNERVKNSFRHARSHSTFWAKDKVQRTPLT